MGYLEECGLYGIEWAMWNRVGYKEECEIYGIECGIMKSVRCVE